MNKYIQYLKDKKQLWLIVGGMLLGGVLLIFGNVGIKESTDKLQNETVTGENFIISYTEYTEAEIASLCNKIDGVSDTRAIVTFEGGFEHIYVNNGECIAIGSGNTRYPVIEKENAPKIVGIGIVCRGGGDPGIQREICSLLSAAFDISSNRIYVTGGK